MPRQGVFHVESGARMDDRPGGFRILHSFRIRLADGDQQLADVDVTFGLDFDSEQPMTTEILGVFREVNLPVNTWPYVREYLSATLGRMTWVPFTLPALKRGTETTETEAKPTSEKAPAERPSESSSPATRTRVRGRSSGRAASP
jgi:hypothetical protein